MENEKYINKEELRIMLHISKRKASWMLENGVIPCINSGKKTRQFKIKLSDVEEFVRTGKEINAPVGQFSAAKYNKRKLIHTRLTEQELAIFREYLTYKFRHKPDALTIIQAKKLIGYSASTISGYVSSGKIKGVTYFSHFILPKDDLIAFLTSAYGNKIVNKSKAHTKLIDDWKCQFELLHIQPLHDMISSDTET